MNINEYKWQPVFYIIVFRPRIVSQLCTSPFILSATIELFPCCCCHFSSDAMHVWLKRSSFSLNLPDNTPQATIICANSRTLYPSDLDRSVTLKPWKHLRKEWRKGKIENDDVLKWRRRRWFDAALLYASSLWHRGTTSTRLDRTQSLVFFCLGHLLAKSWRNRRYKWFWTEIEHFRRMFSGDKLTDR